MSQTNDGESRLLRFLELEDGLHRPTARQSSPQLVKATSSVAPVDGTVILDGDRARRSCSAPDTQEQATACEVAASLSLRRDVGLPNASSSSSSSDTQEEAATPPPHSRSSHNTITSTAVAHTSLPSTPPLSLSHPVVQFLSRVQLQGYADRLLCDLGIQSIAELLKRSANSKDVAALLGPSASLQQQNEFLRGLRRWQREEARRAKAEAAEGQRGARKQTRPTKGVTKELGTNKSRSCAAKTTAQSATTSSSEHGGSCVSERGGGSACFGLADVCDCSPQSPSSTTAFCTTEAAPHLISSDRGTVVASSLEIVTAPALPYMSSSWCSSLTTSATQLMRQLSYRCSHSRLATARRRAPGGSPSCHNGCSDHGESLGATLMTATKVQPYDVDAEDVDAVTMSGTSSRCGSNHRGGSDASEVSCRLETSVPPAGVAVCSDTHSPTLDEESFSRRGQQASTAHAARIECSEVEEGTGNAEELLPPASLSSAGDSYESHLSSVVRSLYESAEGQSVVPNLNGSDSVGGERPSRTHWAPAVWDTPCAVFSNALSGDDCATAASYHLIHNSLSTTRNISLSALSACAELQVLPPRGSSPAAPVRASISPAAEEVERTASDDPHTITATSSVLESHATCSTSQHHRHTSPASLTRESVTPSRQSGQTDFLSTTTGAAVATGNDVEERLAAARGRLNDALQEALQSYNAEVKAILQTTAMPLMDTTTRKKCVPLRAVVQPMLFSSQVASAHPGSVVTTEVGTPAEWVVWALGAGSSGIDVGETPCCCASPVPTRSVLAGAGVDVPAAGSAASGVALDFVCVNDMKALSAVASTDTSARTTMRPTAAPVALSSRSTLKLATAAEVEGLVSTVSVGGLTAEELMVPRFSREKEGEEEGGTRCGSVGRLTTDTQHFVAYVKMSDAGEVSAGPTVAPIGNAATEGRGGDSMAGFLWVSQDPTSTMRRSPHAGASSADSNRAEIVSASDEWWAAYGIEALEYTQNSAGSGAGTWAASPSTHSVPPHITSNGGGTVSMSRVCTPSPAPVDVIELTSGTDDADADTRSGDDEERDARSRPPEASCPFAHPRVVSSLPPSPSSPPHDGFGEGITAPSRTAFTAPLHSLLPWVLDKRLDADAWQHMTNAELRQLCAEFGLSALSPTEGDTTPPFPAAAACCASNLARRGHSAPLTSSAGASPTSPKSAVSHESSVEKDLFGLPRMRTAAPATRSEASRTGAPSDNGGSQTPEPSSPICAFTQPEKDPGGTRAAVASAASGPADIQQRRPRRAAVLERESLLEALRLLVTRLRFRHTIAPFFLHRVERLSGITYKRVRAADLLDEGAVLTRDDLKQTRLRYKTEEQVEVDRCIVSALVAEAAEAVEQDSERVASRWTTRSMSLADSGNDTAMKVAPVNSALASLPDGGVVCCYDQILLREPVNVDATVAVVQKSFPHIAHTRVQQLLAANEVIPEVVVAVSTRSRLPLGQLSTSAHPEAGQAIAVPRPSGEVQDDATPSTQQTNSSDILRHRGNGAAQSMATPTPASQEERQRANARRYFAQRGYRTRRRGDVWGGARR
ncbi:hypothetical protein, conserved [Leishmania tarentolae]|uniref:Uncharacterized protein n=1 Tax=Leishmania tarentolae TaxID=5689 RepID=A0A640KF85_LEITA|nr:hypothetical protein, conserved [Leishmania tarentolae]